MLAQVDENGLRDESDEVGGLEVGVLMMVEHVDMQDRLGKEMSVMFANGASSASDVG